MAFDFDSWKQAVIGSAQGSISEADLLDASGLTERETLTDAFEAISDELEEEIEEAKRRLDRDD